MTEIDFFDDNICVNHKYSLSMIKDYNLIAHFAIEDLIQVVHKEVDCLPDCTLITRDQDIVNLVVSAEMKMNNTTVDNLNLLYKAIDLGKEENIRLLLDYGTRISAKDKFGKTPLHYIIDLGCQDKRRMLTIAKLLLDKAPDAKFLLNECTNSGETPLHYAVVNNKKELIKLFLQYGGNINAKDRDGKSPLYLAIEHRQIEIATLLLKNHAKVNDKMIHGLTILHEAVRQKIEKGVRLLLNFGAKVSVKDIQGKTSLHLAAESNYLDEVAMDKIVKLLLNKGADVNDHANSGETAFHYAIIDGNEKLVRLFLDYGADVNSKDFDGKSSLHFAVKHSNKNIVKLLLDRGAEIGNRTNDGQMALHVAVIVEDENIVKTLLEHNADVNATDESGRTPLSLAFEVAHMRSIYNPWTGFYPINSQIGCDDNIFELLIKHIAILKNVCEENFRVMSNNEKLNLFYRRCQMELRKMKADNICDNISMYKILTEDIHKVAGYTRNENLLSVFESGVCAREFPIYNHTLSKRFYKADYRRKLLEMSAINLTELVRTYVLPELVIDNILIYLTVEDLTNLRMT